MKNTNPLPPTGCAVAILLIVLTMNSCAGLGFTFRSLTRSSSDYDALDDERARGAASPDSIRAETPAAYWTQYRGPVGDGEYDEAGVDLTWTAVAPRRLWSAAVGPAYSSVVVAGGLVVTMEQRREREAVVAFDLEDGTVVWEHAWPGRFYNALSKEGPRATPAIQDGLVVALGAEGELRCVALETGDLRWRRSLLDGSDANLNFGIAASPRILGDAVIAQGADHVAAFELATGELRWRALSETMAYSTPQFGELLGETHVVVCAKKRIVGLDPSTGAELWSFPWKFLGDTCTQPLVLSPDRVLASSGHGKGAQLVRLVDGEEGLATEVLWRSRRFKTRYNEPVQSGRFAYGLDEGMLACLDVETGERVWKEGRYGYGQLLLIGERLLVVDEDGDVHVLRLGDAGPSEELCFEGVDGGMTLNVPALAHGRLFVRNERELVAFDLRGPER
ncbi:MAG: PQQ-binding-like beta-propeller repeat protein [Planctomycetota bacterium]